VPSSHIKRITNQTIEGKPNLTIVPLASKLKGWAHTNRDEKDPMESSKGSKDETQAQAKGKGEKVRIGGTLFNKKENSIYVWQCF
jgi:hypothetical protein